ncbi:ABC transporter permease [Rhodoplanes sp.]|uniref:ABC transporter permease n=1 Tax=Rhodoplanes sp. TaxID=1968906 RepID=UPI0025FB7D1C|nr:ABC transporter permease subunit [Rhodoplanes sp.]
MAETRTIVALPITPRLGAVMRLRLFLILGVLIMWEATAASGLLFRDVVPSSVTVVRALVRLLIDPDFWGNFGVTAGEVLAALAIGATAGLAAGLLLGASRFLGRAYEPYLNSLAPTPKIIFFPVMIMAFGVYAGSKVAMGALSAFFPVALSTAGGMREVDAALVKVGRSFRLSTWQMVTKIYLPAIRVPVLNGMRLGFGVAVIGVLLAETKLSNQGLGYLVMQAYARFDMPQMYAILLVVFAVAVALNAGLGRLTEPRHRRT